MTQASHSAPKLLTERSGPDFGFYGIWLAAAIVLIVLPLIFSSGGSLTSFSLIGIAIIFALSYNILLGQTGLLSFGHAVHYGLGGFLAVHAMNAVANYDWPIPLPFIPLIGGVGGLAFAIVIGWVMTKRAGTVFAMISLGVGELVASSSLILRSVFGGESGITQQALASRLQIVPSRLVALLDTLDSRGLVERRRNQDDRRSHALHLTADGRKMLGTLGEISREHQRDLLASLSDDERRQLHELLQRVADEQGLTRHVHPGYSSLGSGKVQNGPQ